MEAAPLSQSKLLTVLYKQERPLKRGGLFQISKIEGNNLEKQKAVQSTMQENNITWFMATGRKDLNTPILQKELPLTEDLNDVEYIIQEKDTLRFATETECEKLKSSSSNSEIAVEIQKDSYGRLAMAYQRARGRLENHLELYNKIFNFEPHDGIFAIKMNGKEDKSYTSYNIVTIKEEYKNLTLKKVLEILQVYNVVNKGQVAFPLLVNLPLGQSSYQVLLSRNLLSKNPTPKSTAEALNQVIVSTKVEGQDIFIASSYTFLLGMSSDSTAIYRKELGITGRNDSPVRDEQLRMRILQSCYCTEETRKLFKSHPYALKSDVMETFKDPEPNNNNWSKELNPEDQKELANYLIRCLDSKLNDQPEEPAVWKQQALSVRKQLVEFIALTQIAESNHGQDYNYTRTPGMNKLARRILRQIAEGTNTFQEAFNIIQNKYEQVYLSIGMDGSIRAKEHVRDIRRMHYKVERDKIDCYGARCDELSTDSDEELPIV